LTGVIIGSQTKRRVKDIDALVDTFTRMLLLSEHRGPHATGVAWVKRDGSMYVAKEPLPASQFVQSDDYLDWLLGIDRQVTYLMGHTRWPSRGSVRNPANNHPLVLPVGDGYRLALTHNGTIFDHARHLIRLGLPRTTQVDSELLARIAQRHADAHGIDVEAFLADLAPLDGSMSLALVATTRPEEIYASSVAGKQRPLNERSMKYMAPEQKHPESDMQPEYDFHGGTRGKHAQAYHQGHTIAVHQADDSVRVEHFVPKEGAVVLEPDVRKYFPDAESVNAALRSLIALIPKKRKAG
jgi:hypothetical protein